MGLNQSKSEIPYVRDRVRLCDGLEPLDSSAVAAAGAGRFVFILGGFKFAEIPDDTVSIMMDYVDLLLSKRVRFSIDFHNFGDLTCFYALNERTVVLVDINQMDETVRQRLVIIDPEKATAHAFLDRGYRLNTRGEVELFLTRSAVSEDRVITKIGMDNEERLILVYPKNPLDLRTPVVDLTNVMNDAANRLRREANTADYEFEIADWKEPFFLSPTKVGFFTSRIDIRARQLRQDGVLDDNLIDTSCVEHSYVVAYNLQEDDISIVRIQLDPDTNFPCNHEQQPPYESLSASGASNQLGLLITDRHSTRGWHATAALLLKKAAEMTDFISRSFVPLPRCFDNLRKLSFRVKDMRKVRFGLLDTNTMRWREQPAVANQMKFHVNGIIRLSVFPDGHFLIYDRESQARSSARVIGDNSSNSQKPKEELRVLSNPGKCFSLKTLAEMQLRKRPIARLAIIQIAARIQY